LFEKNAIAKLPPRIIRIPKKNKKLQAKIVTIFFFDFFSATFSGFISVLILSVF